MKDIFVSYSRKDSATAEKFITVLKEEGWSVFWDVEILPGRSWSDQLERKLKDCKCIVVMWSKSSLQSHYVKEEAALGRNAKKLVPIMIDAGINPPFGFGMLEAAMLSDWDGDKNNREYKNLIKAITELVPPTGKVTESVTSPSVDATTKTASIPVSKTKTYTPTKQQSNSKTPLILGLSFLAAVFCFSFFKQCSSSDSEPKTPKTKTEIPKTKTPETKDNPITKPLEPTDSSTNNSANNTSEINRLKKSISDINMSTKKIIDQELQDVANKKKKIVAPGEFTALKNKRAELDTRMKKWVADGSNNLGQLKAIEYDTKSYSEKLKRTLSDIFQVTENIGSDAKRLITQLFDTASNESQRKSARNQLMNTYGKNSPVMGELIKQCAAAFRKDLRNDGIFQAIWTLKEIAKKNPEVLRPHKQTLFEFFDKANKVYKTRTKGQMDSIRRNLN